MLTEKDKAEINAVMEAQDELESAVRRHHEGVQSREEFNAGFEKFFAHDAERIASLQRRVDDLEFLLDRVRSLLQHALEIINREFYCRQSSVGTETIVGLATPIEKPPCCGEPGSSPAAGTLNREPNVI